MDPCFHHPGAPQLEAADLHFILCAHTVTKGCMKLRDIIPHLVDPLLEAADLELEVAARELGLLALLDRALQRLRELLLLGLRGWRNKETGRVPWKVRLDKRKEEKR
jgi:hypothetical protein